MRFDSLDDDYVEAAIMERLSGKRVVTKRNEVDEEAERKAAEYVEAHNATYKPNLLIDIQAKIRAGAGGAYQQWMQVFNLKQAGRTLIWLEENGIDSYDNLCEKAAAASKNFHERSDKLKEIETRQKHITELQKQIGYYGKSGNVYAAYKRSGWDKDLFEANRADITLHKAAKKYFEGQGFKGKLPSINSLKQEWATLDAERRKLYVGYKEVKEKHSSLGTAKANADRMLRVTPEEQDRYNERVARKQKSHDYGAI